MLGLRHWGRRDGKGIESIDTMEFSNGLDMGVREKETLNMAPQFLPSPDMPSLELNFIEVQFKKQFKVYSSGLFTYPPDPHLVPCHHHCQKRVGNSCQTIPPLFLAVRV